MEKLHINNTNNFIQVVVIKNQLINIIKSHNYFRLFTILELFLLFTVHRTFLCGWWLYIQLTETPIACIEGSLTIGGASCVKV